MWVPTGIWTHWLVISTSTEYSARSINNSYQTFTFRWRLPFATPVFLGFQALPLQCSGSAPEDFGSTRSGTKAPAWRTKVGFHRGYWGRDKIQYFTIPSQNLTWNLKMAPWNRRFLWKPSFLGSMLNFGRVFHRNSAQIWTNAIENSPKSKARRVEPWTTFFSGSAAR